MKLYELKFALVFSYFIFSFISGYAQTPIWSGKNIHLGSPWAGNVTPSNAYGQYPRPQMVRSNWINLNGLWDYRICDVKDTFPSFFESKILVPYPIESQLSGVNKSLLPTQNLWYKKTFQKPKIRSNERLILHFGAVDWKATVFVNGKKAIVHKGGYTSFSQDITDLVKNGDNVLTVQVFDPTDQGIGPHGKQMLQPENIYYTPSSGIWQTVWMEVVPDKHIERYVIVPNIDSNSFQVKVECQGDLNVVVKVIDDGKIVSELIGKSNTMLSGKIVDPHLWSPNSPFLYTLDIAIYDGKRKKDQVKGYFGMRKFSIAKDNKGTERIFLNNEPYFNLGILDQGFWPDGLYTAPTEDAMKFDIEVIKAMGFNTIRKHIKIEPARWYYYTDSIGLLVWQDFVNPNQGLPEGAKEEFEVGVRETIEQLRNITSIATWVVFNEKWGSYNQKGVTEWVKSLDHSRIVNGHSGELLYVNDKLRSPSPDAYASSDIIDIHAYPNPRKPTFESNKASVIGEFGGIGVPIEGHIWDDLQTGWGYDGLENVSSLRSKYTYMIDSIVRLKEEGVSGVIYTQPFDVESEQNGLLTYDRKVIKLPIRFFADINSRVYTNSYATRDSDSFSFLSSADSAIISYGARKKEFEKHINDSAFLRSLIVMGIGQNDTAFISRVGNEYFRIVRDPISKANFKLLVRTTNSVNDVGFSIIGKHDSIINRLSGPNTSEYLLMNIIYSSEIKPGIISGNPNWDSISHSVVPKYGQLASERLNSAKMIYFLEHEDWSNYGKAYKIHFDNMLTTNRNVYHINNLTWHVFVNVKDTAVLSTAIKAIEYSLSKFDMRNPNAYDTYANLLYKIGRREDALKIAAKAVEVSKNNKEFVETYQRMKNGTL
ncbi:Glycosyl hydrolases family 2, TIM barrel domain [Chitinophaga sp. YR627]|uniref:glycoside hydrolase family 2 protein n=1 Tax=Chitinophaga sp. YR627 TaxID=1881041 RepID=UPI0008DF7995|nr:sugar-binding domain-containing protein [Chitinophaga sp. YR627]SFO29616.1 Glycosyl hydrolases family 2, TIM barrel domain [Chitinophaga sp. YR627]